MYQFEGKESGGVYTIELANVVIWRYKDVSMRFHAQCSVGGMLWKRISFTWAFDRKSMIVCIADWQIGSWDKVKPVVQQPSHHEIEESSPLFSFKWNSPYI